MAVRHAGFVIFFMLPNVIVNWSVNLYACVQHSTCSSCRIPSHANPTLRIIKARSIGVVNKTKLVDGRPRVLVVRWRRRPSESRVYYSHK